jgi:preprotein translocase subunit YajC
VNAFAVLFGSTHLVAAAKSSGSPLSLLAPLVLLGGFFYLFMIRPQKRKARQHEDLVSALVPGDEVVTIGGIVGYIKSIEEDAVNLEIADGCVVRVLRQAIGRKVEAPSPGTAPGGSGLEGTAGPDDTE